jgi:hypothetical protein
MDGGRNSVFAHALIPELKKKNLSLSDLGREVRAQVAQFAQGVGATKRPSCVDETDAPIYLAGRN